MIQYKNIVLEGNIGAGKTTAASMLSEKLNGRLILESFENNPFLEFFYKDQERYAFQVELFFLAERYHQLSKNLLGDIFNEYTVFDYIFTKSAIFSGITLNGNEKDLFNNLYHIMNRFMPKPDILIYLHQPIERVIEQINKRGRTYEQDIPEEYLKEVERSYFGYFKEEMRFPIVILKTEEINNYNVETIQSYIFDILSKDWRNGLSYYPD
ncbi:MAG: deoxynucleoside kinase [Salibacteraceae bacterium]|jgi:deoxyguanosine kinase|nr:deoxynucleoside kinase [Salibacteraceae bacterium]MDP4685425.1 deoxynucleoside kinase [Salibacteraceae bacterium]MDP4763882.1 deoxynucleoside kinase [Salibacteraceae bacterium]MDP4845373.1 deoxynucleoside kinase [Salibacteraceae bacterium]MDP4966156.1 deoxynucleoside kinase [Salibacteraceae bacterium]